MSHIGYPRCTAKVPYYDNNQQALRDMPCRKRAVHDGLCRTHSKKSGDATKEKP